ncbi:hypothetical protein AALP_AA2G190900 [Arabis alpina]|uniref:Uncharacterized protein n=1 Tax=Arabis alpina TaxID=50452 RepID=A0A087HII2_ARAAL|nr:hypothetical protein AALP_AA2G190900 [Arabis alpina]
MRFWKSFDLINWPQVVVVQILQPYILWFSFFVRATGNCIYHRCVLELGM